MPDGSDCWRLPEPDGYAGICTEHMHDVAKAWLGDTGMRRDRCPHCDFLSLSRDRLSRAIFCIHCGRVIEVLPDPDVVPRNLGPSRDDRPAPRQFPRTDVVYYIRFGDRIKIGTSTNLPKRLTVLPYDELLAIEPGNVSREKARHREFAASLIPGQLEWFEATPALLAHAAALRQRFGPPMAAWRNWITRPAA